MGKLWDLVQDWRDGMEFPPSDRQVALRLDLSPGVLTGWKNGLTEVPKRSSLWALHELTNIPFDKIVQAAIDDAGLFDQERAKEAAEVRASRRSAGKAEERRRARDDD